MEKRKLGNSGTIISAMGIGAMSFTDFYGKTDERESHAILKLALDLGIDNIDTSNLYGKGISEKRIGTFLREQGKRGHSLFKIATKAGIRVQENGDNYFDNSKEHLEAELDQSLMRLGVDQIELFYVHRRDHSRSIEEVTETLASFVKSGKARQIGFSEIAPTSLSIANAIHPIAAVQSEYSLATRLPELGLVQKTLELGTTLVAFSPLGRGLLTDNPPDGQKVETIPFFRVNPRFMYPNLQRNIDASARFRELAADMGTRAASLAVSWVLHKGEHIQTIPGTRSVQHLRELAEGAVLKLKSSDLEAIESVLPVGWAHGDRYPARQWISPECYC